MLAINADSKRSSTVAHHRGAIPGGGGATGPSVGNQNAVMNQRQTGSVQTFPWRRASTTQATVTPFIPRVVRSSVPSAEFPFRAGPGKCFEDKEKCFEACWDARVHNYRICNQYGVAGNRVRYDRCTQGATNLWRECMADCDGQ